MRTGFRHRGTALSFFLPQQAAVPAPGLIFYLTLPLQEAALGSFGSRPTPLLSAKSILYFPFHPRQVSAETVVLNPAQKLAQTALNWIWWLLRQFLPLCEGGSGLICSSVSLPPVFPVTTSNSPPPCLSSLAFFYPSLGQGPMKQIKFFNKIVDLGCKPSACVTLTVQFCFSQICYLTS